MSSQGPLDLNDIQGDILDGLPKKNEIFYFFSIVGGSKSISMFRTQLAKLSSTITAAAEVQGDRNRIREEKKRASLVDSKDPQPRILDITGVNIAFSQQGLLQASLGITDDIGDQVFKDGQAKDAAFLGDDIGTWDAAFKNPGLHGVILITGGSQLLIDDKLAEIKSLFGVGARSATITEIIPISGQVREAEPGHEHFGFEDGISQPAVKGVPGTIQKGQDVISPGVILLSREGDVGIVPKGSDLTAMFGVRTGSQFLQIRDGKHWHCRSNLQENVPEFNAFLQNNGEKFNPTTASTGAAGLLGARLVGRWKSGAPVERTPSRDDPAMATNASENNAFRFNFDSQKNCPFAAHIRKTNPRADLDGFGGTEARRIIRRGIPFGDDVSPSEDSAGETTQERGLLFACYQSNLANGFQFMQTSWANDPTFPPKGRAGPPVTLPGVDPIIGQNRNRSMVGASRANAKNVLPLPNAPKEKEWVVSKGGEYFFSPSISALKNTFAEAA